MIRSVAHTLDDATVTLDGVAIARASTPADLDADAVVIDDIAIEWSRATGYGHQQPGTLTVRLLAPTLAAALDLCRHGATLTVTVTAGALTWTIGYGTVTVPTYTRRPGRWLVTLHAQDVISHAAGLRVSAAPWPSQSGTARAAAINAAVGRTALVFGYAAVVAARDVDGGPSLLELAQDTSPAGYSVVEHTTAGQITSRHPPAHAIVWPFTITGQPRFSGGIIPSPINGALVDVGPGRVEDSPRTLDRAAWVTDVRITGRNADGSDVTITYSPLPAVQRGAAVAAWSSDYRHLDSATNQANYADWAASVVAEAQPPAASLDDTRIILTDLAPAAVRDLTALGRRVNTVLVVGSSPASPDVEATYVQTRGVITLRGHVDGPQLRLTSRLQPSRLAGLRPTRFDDIPHADTTVGTTTTHRPRFTDAAGSNPRWRIRDFTLVTTHRPPLPLGI